MSSGGRTKRSTCINAASKSSRLTSDAPNQFEQNVRRIYAKRMHLQAQEPRALDWQRMHAVEWVWLAKWHLEVL
jgi:hypothetical protein